MADELVGSKEIALVGSDGKVHKTGSIRPPGAIPLDSVLGQADIPVPISVDLGESIVTLTPSAMPVAMTKGYNDKVMWVAIYADGTTITQCDENGQTISSEEIDHKTLREFKLVDQLGKTVVSQSIEPGQCFFYRRRTALQTGRDVVEIIHLFGWRILTSGQAEEKEWLVNTVFLFESDLHVEVGSFKSIINNDLSESKQWKYAPNWRDIDEVAAE